MAAFFPLLHGRRVQLEDLGLPDQAREAQGPGIVARAQQHDLGDVIFHGLLEQGVEKAGAGG